MVYTLALLKGGLSLWHMEEADGQAYYFNGTALFTNFY